MSNQLTQRDNGHDTLSIAPDSEPQPITQYDITQLGPVAKRLSKAMQDVRQVARRGRNTYHNYDYATAEDVKNAAREALSTHGLTVMPFMRNVLQRQQGKNIITRVQFDMIVACEDGFVVMPWVGEAQDVGDKGVNKASTTGLKYFLINLLQISTGDEPDADADHSDEQTQTQNQPPQQHDNSDGANAHEQQHPVSDAMRKKFHALGTELYGDRWDEKRPEIVSAATKGSVTSSKDLGKRAMSRLIELMEAELDAKSELDELEAELDTEPVPA